MGGPKLGTGTNAEHSITVAQLPDAAELVFTTLETHSHGTVSRWIQLPDGQSEPECPAPVLKLKATTAGGAPAPRTSPGGAAWASPPSAAASSAAPQAVAGRQNSGGSSGVAVLINLRAALAVAVAGWLIRRRHG
ncbi:DUF1775 domain-containing protein [Peterkaempfera sp. SMS 1(5)a]|uniref:DUF1775 domain-containing protein n=1 Tax=Peterkaempfera podocarpi TaxID=3232308 RepID=UPI0036710D86